MSDRLRVLSVPHRDQIAGQAESGIKTLIGKYFQHLPEFDIELVGHKATSFDLLAIHAGMTQKFGNGPMVSHIHGLYWTADLPTSTWQFKANANVIAAIKHATVVTAPSEWTAQTLRRDMHMPITVIPHAIDVDEWQSPPLGHYVLWNKNRDSDVCDPKYLVELARRNPHMLFMSTFANDEKLPNLRVTGLVPHAQMKQYVEDCGVYLSTTKETFGIGILEAMAAGRPVLGFAEGNITSLVQHGINGYLARPGNFADLVDGLRYCLQHGKALGANGRALARAYRWPEVARQVADLYRSTVDLANSSSASVTVVIPCYNKAATLRRAVDSVLAQTLAPNLIVLVDNNSTDDSRTVARTLASIDSRIVVLSEGRQGVAYARNTGVAHATTRYVCCLDADDEIMPDFLAVCVDALEKDRTLGLAYTKMQVEDTSGKLHNPDWPDQYTFNDFLVKKNPVPTCNVFRRDVWERLGGYRQRYAPQGAGAEDAEFWMRMGAAGYPGILASQQRLFRYHLGGAVGGNPDYREVDWLYWHPYVRDNRHPLASAATSREVSHFVAQYDCPEISVVIPMSPNHVDQVVDALDSLEAQTLRKWEAIVVADGFVAPLHLRKVYPFAHWLTTGAERKGAGVARNAGASKAVAPLLLFLDADDWLEPTALSDLHARYVQMGGIVYSDYIGHATIDAEESTRLDRAGRLISYDPKTQRAVMLHRAAIYDCGRAQQQPSLEANGQFYIWNLITSLVPKVWHDEIGGFDEAMPSWEDWDYWIRMARVNKCYTHLASPLVHYRFDTGERREIGKTQYDSLVHHMRDKYRKEPAMACGGCGKKKEANNPPAMLPASRSAAPMSSDAMVLVQLTDGNIGDHPIRIRDFKTNKVHDYDYRKDGETFYMNREHAALYPNKFRIIESRQPEPDVTPIVQPEPPELLVDEVEVNVEPEAEDVKEPEELEEAEEPEPIGVKVAPAPPAKKHSSRGGPRRTSV